MHWTAAPSALALGQALKLSFQRYLIADAPPLPAIPRSLGVLEPALLDDRHFVVALHDEEGVWIAVEFGSTGPLVSIRCSNDDEDGNGALVEQIPGSHRNWMVAGFDYGDLRRIALDECASISIEAAHTDEIQVDLVDPATFRRLTGREPPPPAKQEDGYGGWLLP